MKSLIKPIEKKTRERRTKGKEGERTRRGDAREEARKRQEERRAGGRRGQETRREEKEKEKKKKPRVGDDYVLSLT